MNSLEMPLSLTSAQGLLEEVVVVGEEEEEEEEEGFFCERSSRSAERN